MKKIIALCAVLALFSAGALHAQFTGPGGQGQFGQNQSWGGFSGPSRNISAAQASALPHKAPVIMRGNIVQMLNNDRFLFRDSSGEIVVKIKHNRWQGLTVGPNEQVEIAGELKRDKWDQQLFYADVKLIRKI